MNCDIGSLKSIWKWEDTAKFSFLVWRIHDFGLSLFPGILSID